MAIYNNLKCVYIHIPKTGGQSIMNVLSRAEADCTMDNQYELDHLTMIQTLERMKPESYFKFAIVRHPMERLISEYRFSKKYRPYLPDSEHFTFAEYVQAIAQLPIDLMPHMMANHLYTQTKFLYDKDELLVDCVGRFEAMTYAIKFVSQKLQKDLPELPHLNKSICDEETIACDTQTKLLVRQMYAEDYKRFGYK